MAPLPPDGTPRFRVNYSILGGDDHDFQIRSAGSPSVLGVDVDTFLTALGASIFQLTVGVVEFAASGSNVFLPVLTGIEGQVYGTGTPDPIEKPYFYGFQGRSAGGPKWHLDVFGARSLGVDFRLQPGENTGVDDGIAALQGFASPILAIDGLAVTVYTYANAGSNAHWQRAQRP